MQAHPGNSCLQENYGREILSLKKRALTTIVENYHKIFTHREDLLDCIPKPLRKEIFSRLVNRGILVNELFARVVDKNESSMDLKSVAGLNDDSCRILSHCKKASTIFLTDVGASSEAMVQMFSQMNWLKTLEITRTMNFNDLVLEAIAFNCPCVKVLCVSRTGITDEGIKSLADNSISLVALDVSYTQVTFAGVDSLISSPCGKTLKEFKCRKSRICGREEILASILGFPKLEDYSFTFSSNEEADWVLQRVTTRLKNFAFNIPV